MLIFYSLNTTSLDITNFSMNVIKASKYKFSRFHLVQQDDGFWTSYLILYPFEYSKL